MPKGELDWQSLIIEVFRLLKYDTVLPGNFLPAFRSHLLYPFSGLLFGKLFTLCWKLPS